METAWSGLFTDLGFSATAHAGPWTIGGDDDKTKGNRPYLSLGPFPFGI